MYKGIGPDLFAALMRLSAPERADLLEFIGQSPVGVTGVMDPVTQWEYATANDAPEMLRDGAEKITPLVGL